MRSTELIEPSKLTWLLWVKIPRLSGRNILAAFWPLWLRIAKKDCCLASSSVTFAWWSETIGARELSSCLPGLVVRSWTGFHIVTRSGESTFLSSRLAKHPWGIYIFRNFLVNGPKTLVSSFLFVCLSFYVSVFGLYFLLTRLISSFFFSSLGEFFHVWRSLRTYLSSSSRSSSLVIVWLWMHYGCVYASSERGYNYCNPRSRGGRFRPIFGIGELCNFSCVSVNWRTVQLLMHIRPLWIGLTGGCREGQCFDPLNRPKRRMPWGVRPWSRLLIRGRSKRRPLSPKIFSFLWVQTLTQRRLQLCLGITSSIYEGCYVEAKSDRIKVEITQITAKSDFYSLK